MGVVSQQGLEDARRPNLDFGRIWPSSAKSGPDTREFGSEVYRIWSTSALRLSNVGPKLLISSKFRPEPSEFGRVRPHLA